MNMKIIFIVMFLLGMASCYDDKGNYDYKEMNDIEVHWSILFWINDNLN